MKILVDTHAFLWHAEGSSQMSLTATNLLVDPTNPCIRLVHQYERRPPYAYAGPL